MSNIRIRYVSNPDGSTESLQIFKARDGREYRSIISHDGLTGYVVTMPARQVIMQLTATSFHKIKIKLKAALKNLGVIFLNEKRQPKRPPATSSENAST
jgi:hypothetical protein